MTPSLIVDTGPLVALWSARDNWHRWAREALLPVKPPLVTCEAVITETLFVLSRNGAPYRPVIEMMNRGVLEIALQLGEHKQRVSELMDRFADVPMSLADACLVRLSELNPGIRVATLDSDFLTYRRKDRSSVPLLMPKQLRKR